MTSDRSAVPIADLVLRVRCDASSSGAESGPGWATPDHEARRLRRRLAGEAVVGGGFGGPWPVVVLDRTAVVAPGVPGIVGREGMDGPDGLYRLAGDSVWRTAAAGTQRLLELVGSEDPPGDRVDLLWFGDTSRWLVRHGVIEVEDQFSRLTVPATRARLEHLLVRGRRVDSEVLDGVPADEDAAAPARVEVWRESVLVPEVATEDASSVIGRRPEVERVELRGDTLHGRDADGRPVVLAVEHDSTGWRVERIEGALPFETLRVERREPLVHVMADVAATIDCLAPGMRQRLVFDLFADLVFAGRARDQNA